MSKKQIWGYARVSSRTQNLESQLDILREEGIPDEFIIQEKITGITKERKLYELIEQLKEGDKIVVTSITRLGRKANQLMQLIEDLEEKGIDLEILDFGISTKGKMGKFFMQIASAFSELERETLKERQMAGIAIAKNNPDVTLGRPKIGVKNPKMRHALELYFDKKKTIREICESTGVSKASLYRRIAELKAEECE